MSSNGKPVKTLLLTGAGGALGRVLAPALRTLCQRLLLSDLPGPLEQLQKADAGADAVPCDLADAAAVLALLQGVQAVVHLGGISVEAPFEPILQANIRGVVHLYEAARRQGTKRIVFASSNHVTGCYERAQRIGPGHPPRPDGQYGLSKLYGEGLAQVYWDRYGIESVCLRIGTANAENRPPDRRGLSTWLSHADLVRLVTAALTAPNVGCMVAYGVSANARSWWDSEAAWAQLGYVPQDNAEVFAAEVGHLRQPAGSNAERDQGGMFVQTGPFE